MVKSFRNFFLLIAVVITTLMISGCKKEQGQSGVYTMYTVKFIVNGETYYTDYVFEGKPVKEPNSPVLEGYKFLYWSYGGLQYDFNSPVEEAMNLHANLEECATLPLVDGVQDEKLEEHKFNAKVDLLVDSVNKSNGVVASGSEFSCYFYLHNTKNYDITFTFTLSSDSEIIDNLKFHFREVKKETSGITYQSIKSMESIQITIPAGHRIMYSIDWKINLEMSSSVIIKTLLCSIKLDNFKRAV